MKNANNTVSMNREPSKEEKLLADRIVDVIFPASAPLIFCPEDTDEAPDELPSDYRGATGVWIFGEKLFLVTCRHVLTEARKVGAEIAAFLPREKGAVRCCVLHERDDLDLVTLEIPYCVDLISPSIISGGGVVIHSKISFKASGTCTFLGYPQKLREKSKMSYFPFSGQYYSSGCRSNCGKINGVDFCIKTGFSEKSIETVRHLGSGVSGSPIYDICVVDSRVILTPIGIVKGRIKTKSKELCVGGISLHHVLPNGALCD